MTTLILLAALLTLATGAMVYWANAHRFTNQVFIAFSLISTGWLFCVYMAMRTGQLAVEDPALDPVPCLGRRRLLPMGHLAPPQICDNCRWQAVERPAEILAVADGRHAAGPVMRVGFFHSPRLDPG
jgi:hypothetical protein